MSLIENMPYKKSFIVKDNLDFQMEKQTIFITKYFCNTDICDRYYLRANANGVDQGYLYFYLNPDNMQSKFIGLETYEEYRNRGIASLLISTWIQFCLDEEFINLQTISKQRKPFVLHLLKKYAFELKNLSSYQKANKIVHICKRGNDSSKCIMFENKHEENYFRRSNIMKNDNYIIVGKDEENIEILDSVVLGTPYFLSEPEIAYQKSLQIYSKYRL